MGLGALLWLLLVVLCPMISYQAACGLLPTIRSYVFVERAASITILELATKAPSISPVLLIEEKKSMAASGFNFFLPSPIICSDCRYFC
ncbi:uncharacterized protein BT62DRAFT_68508 [Guyanagaster necrorhizus]|uniref:Secreted protein n=1 Tax=Guyanagaster necrorhizus TaxID=856835 RepID=A0A9P7VV68_9AGAR|nr:uncharacterized protein BT62DRAFT_68508 [Guyanagaster necrorhizus MCA 3950]KAG7447203.1 hypothetical protein BT62DRAFT_68508 [Guyanagaster necrorhizus MCA 3950]